MIEDSILDVELVKENLKEGGIECELVVVQTRTGFLDAFQNSSFDLILSDYSLPAFDGITALEMVRATDPDLPFILISGVLGEELAIETLKSGATDYILKQRLERLVPSLERALREAEDRRERQRAEEALYQAHLQLQQRAAQLVATNEELKITQEQLRLQNQEFLRARQEAEKEQQRYQDLFNFAPIGILVSSPDGQILQYNQAFCQMLGYSDTELRWLNCREIDHPEDLAKELPYLQQMLQGEILCYQLEKRLRSHNGEMIWIQLTCGLLDSRKEQDVYILNMIENITERRAVEQMKENFVSIVSHELRTPLTSMRGALGLLATGQLGDLSEEGEEVLKIALMECKRLVRLVSDILDLERIKSGHVPLKKEACQVRDLLTRVGLIIKPIAQQAEVTLVVSAIDELVWADPDHIIQTITNLLNNAIKYSPPNSTIWLIAELVDVEQSATQLSDNLPKKQLLFQVKDQGRGIPPNKLEEIFSPFEQVDASDSRTYGGTGLGLAICRSIIEQHGGQIWVESVLGEGSTFYFTLPLLTF